MNITISKSMWKFLKKLKTKLPYDPAIPLWAPVAHTCNHSYSGGRDQEEYNSKSAQGK
jgi:hypothetical protein